MKPKPNKTKRGKPIRCSAWLGCGLVSIITPQVGQWRISRVEADSDVVMSWDGKRLLMLKNRYGANLAAMTPALKRIAEAAPTAAWGSIRNYCSVPAKPRTPQKLPRGLDAQQAQRSDKTPRRGTPAESPKDNRATGQRRTHPRGKNTQSPNSQKATNSYKRVKQPNAGTERPPTKNL